MQVGIHIDKTLHTFAPPAQPNECLGTVVSCELEQRKMYYVCTQDNEKKSTIINTVQLEIFKDTLSKNKKDLLTSIELQAVMGHPSLLHRLRQLTL